jgi:protein gp37
MSILTKIQWCDSTCNPTMGCEGCELWTNKVKKCYAGTLHVRFGGASSGYADLFEEVTLFPGRMQEATRWADLTGTNRSDKPWLDDYPRLIFVSDMSDSLSSTVEFDYLESEIIANVTSELGSRHHWLWLSKRPDRMAKFSRWLEESGRLWPSNLWAGTSITSQNTTSRIRQLLRVGTDSTIRFLSVEPQYEFIDLTPWLPALDWVIQGGESGHGANAFDVDWAYSVIRDCRAHGVPYFLKQLGAVVRSNESRLTFNDAHAGDWSEWPTRLRVRQLPKLATRPSHNANNGSGPAGKQSVNLTQKRRQAALKAWETRRANALASAVEKG